MLPRSILGDDVGAEKKNDQPTQRFDVRRNDEDGGDTHRQSKQGEQSDQFPIHGFTPSVFTEAHLLLFREYSPSAPTRGVRGPLEKPIGHFFPVNSRIRSASAWRYGLPSGCKTSWNQTGGWF